MDFLNSSTPDLNKLRAKIQGIEALKDRKELQAKEKEALANNGMYERYLRLFQVFPQTGNISLRWLDITKSKALDKAKENTIGAQISASVSAALAELGVTLKASIGSKNDLSKTISVPNLLLGLLQEYTLSLEKLAIATTSPSEKKEYEKKKHDYEKILLPKGSTGREGVLKAAILTAVSSLLKGQAGQILKIFQRNC